MRGRSPAYCMIQNGTVLMKEKGGKDRSREPACQEADVFLGWTYVRCRIESLLTCCRDNLPLGILLHTHILQPPHGRGRQVSDGFYK